MFELVGGFVEALSGYLLGRFQAKKTAFHLSAIAVSLLCGLLFFLSYGAYELLYPAPKKDRNILLGLLFFSLIVFLGSYLIIILDFWLKRKKSQA